MGWNRHSKDGRFERHDLKERFWKFVDKSDDPSGCWLWRGSGKDGGGYGYLMIRDSSTSSGKRWLKAHRLSWWIAKGAWPDQHVLHRCDVRLCVNPGHLFLGDDQANVRDMTRKCRNVFQKRNPSKKLAVADVFAIKLLRALGWSLKSLSERFNVRESTVSRIVNGVRRGARSWS